MCSFDSETLELLEWVDKFYTHTHIHMKDEKRTTISNLDFINLFVNILFDIFWFICSIYFTCMVEWYNVVPTRDENVYMEEHRQIKEIVYDERRDLFC